MKEAVGIVSTPGQGSQSFVLLLLLEAKSRCIVQADLEFVM